nr:uncharacterized protein LOC104090488 isoform X1 [Nicotiana tomentosiformis]
MAKNPKNSAPYVRKSSRNKEESTPQNHKPLDLDSLQFEEFSSSRVDLSNDVRSPEIRALEKWPMKDHETISLKKVKSDLDGMYESDINFWTPRIYIVLKEKPIAHGRIIDLDDMKNNSCKLQVPRLPDLFKNSWTDDFEVSFDQAKKCIAEASSDPLPNQLGPKDVNFETKILAHIVATTILLKTGFFFYSISARHIPSLLPSH